MIQYHFTAHAKERMRQRFGITNPSIMQNWINEKIENGTLIRKEKRKDIYQSGSTEIVLDGNRVVSVMPKYDETETMVTVKGLVSKQVNRMITIHERMYRKTEIDVAQLTLNFLKAKNPNIKSLINERLNEKSDDKERILTEITSLKKTAEHYGVDV